MLFAGADGMTGRGGVIVGEALRLTVPAALSWSREEDMAVGVKVWMCV